jgi:predicted ATPase
MIRPFWLSLLARAYGRAGRFEEALEAVSDALATLEATDERFWEAELYRLRGELLLTAFRGASGRDPSAEACFQQALQVARRQAARSLELRAATSLAELWRAQGRVQEARDLLRPFLGWFSEGLDKQDLRTAAALLEQLDSVPAAGVAG